jgi:hypothetical protein
MRTVDLRSAGESVATRAMCTAAGCMEPTSNRKPFCFDHLDRLAYVREIQRELAARERPVLRVLAARPRVHHLRHAV